MGLRQPVVVDITFNTTSVTRVGFGRPIFAAPHRYFSERVRGYPSLQAAADDIPVGTPTYLALQTAFQQQPSPDIVYVGRQDVTTTTLTPNPVANSADYTFQVRVDGTTSTVTYTSDSSATAEEISAGLVAAFNAITPSAPDITIADNTGSLSLTENGGKDFQVFGFRNLTDTYATTETAPQLLSAISDENNDWYFMTCQDHSQDFVLAMAEAIEATEKMYFTSSADAANLVTLSDPVQPTDTFGRLKNGNYSRTVALFHQDAERDFPEIGYVSINATYDAGSVVWANLIPAGFGVSTNTAEGGRSLTFTERNNLNAKSANWVENLGGNPITRRGTGSSGRFIDQTRGRDWLVAETRTELQLLLLNQRGRKIPFTQQGFAQVESSIANAWRRGVNRNFLTGYQIAMPALADIALNDRAQYFLQGIRVTGFLAGGIIEVDMQGFLQFD